MKYPRTYHAPWSPEPSRDDKILPSVNSFLHTPIVISEKLDGSNVALTSRECFARTHSGPPKHPSFNLFKSIHSSIKHKIPDDICIYGEYTFAKHSIFYDKLPSYLHIFAIKSDDIWLSWKDVKKWGEKLGIDTVPVLKEAVADTPEQFEKLTSEYMKQPSLYGNDREGVVVRTACSFHDDLFGISVLKIVRKGHVQTSKHWKSEEIVRNLLVDDEE